MSKTSTKKRIKRTANEANLSSSSNLSPSSNNQLSDLVFSGTTFSSTRLFNWLDTQFTKQNQYISERSDLIQIMIQETKTSIFIEIAKRFNELKTEIINDVSKEICELADRVKQLETVNTEIDQPKTEVKNLNAKILKQDNSAVASDLRITNIPCYDNEDLQWIFENICSSMNITMPFLKSIFRVKHFKNHRDVDNPPIVVKLNSPYEKNFFIKTVSAFRSKYKTSLKLHHAGFESNEPFYINENLTPHNYQIFKSAQRLKKDELLAAAYTQRGIVYVKVNTDDEPLKVEFLEDLKQFFRSSN